MPNYADRAEETTDTSGDGLTISLLGARVGRQTFVSGFTAGATRRYFIESGNGVDWEVGHGTVRASPDELDRDTVLSNSNGDTNRIALSGTSTVASSLPAALILDLLGGDMTGPLTITDAVNIPLVLNNSTGTQTIFDIQDEGTSIFTVKDGATGGNVNRINIFEGTSSANAAIHVIENYSGTGTRQLLLLRLVAQGGGSGIIRGGNYQAYGESAVTGEVWSFVALARAKHDDANLSRLIGGFYRVQIQNTLTPTVAEADAILTELDINDGTFTVGNHIKIPNALTDGGDASIGTLSGIFIDDQTIGDTNYGLILNGDITAGSATVLGAASVYGAGQDATIGYDGTNLVAQPDLVGTGYFHIYTDQALALVIGSGATGIDYTLRVNGETNDGDVTWMEDEDHWRFNDDIALDNGEFLIFDKASGNGIKVDAATPTFGFADLLGDQFAKNTGATKPTLTAYNGAVDAWQFSDGDEAFLSYHVPHDYVLGTDIHLHIHWSQTSATATGGTIDFKYFAIYAKGHNQASGSAFTGTPITASFSSIDINDGGAGLTQYQHHLTEVTISAASATAALFDRDDFEPDGVIELTLEMDTNSLTDSVAVQDPFLHFVDIHYQTTGVIGTKSRTPDFYA